MLAFDLIFSATYEKVFFYLKFYMLLESVFENTIFRDGI